MSPPASSASITTQRLLLTLPPPEAAPRIVAFQRENWDHLAPWSPPRSADEVSVAVWRRRLDRWALEERDGTALRLMLFRKGNPDGSVLGTVSYTSIIRGGFEACYLGYALDQKLEGKGLMREALQASLDHVFKELRLHRVMANHLPHNLRSAGLLKRLGFVPEGYARDYLYIDGTWRDHVLTALINPTPAPPV